MLTYSDKTICIFKMFFAGLIGSPDTFGDLLVGLVSKLTKRLPGAFYSDVRTTVKMSLARVDRAWGWRAGQLRGAIRLNGLRDFVLDFSSR